MPVPIAVAIREQIVQQRESGKNLREIAQEMGMSYNSVRNVWRLYQKEGRISPNYEHCGAKGVKSSQRVYRAALFLKRLHPSWGAPLIRYLLQEKWPEEEIGNVRSLQRWFKQAGLNPLRKKQVGEARKGRSQVVHQVWEMDSREGIVLAGGQAVIWLVVSDEASGAILQGAVFPPSQGQSTTGGNGERISQNLF